MLIKNTNVNSYWFLTGERSMIDYDDHKPNEPSVDYQKTQGSTINTIGVLLPLISTLEEKIKILEQNNSMVIKQLEALVLKPIQNNTLFN